MKAHFFVLILIFFPFSISWSQTEQTLEELPLLVEFTVPAGFYEGELELQLLAPGARIYYTTNGNRPSRKSIRYKKPIRITKTTVIRAVAYLGDKKSPIHSATYFIAEPPTNLPVVSISISPYLLFNDEKGLFVTGRNAIDSIWSKPGANFWSRREVSCNVEIFETDGRCVYSNLSGFRLFGGMSRLWPQKSITLIARNRYGQKRIKHRMFGKEGLKQFKFLVVRNAGSDFGKMHGRDAILTDLVKDWDIETQDFRSAQVYINGKYWGLYNIREKLNRYFLAGHYDVDKDSVDLMEHRMVRKRGSRSHYRKMLQFLKKNNLRDTANYAALQTQMEIDNFMNLQVAQIYFDNQDAGGNIKFWRPQTPNGRWRWILFDTDWGFGLHDPNAYKNNSLQFHTTPSGPSWPNPPCSTFILRKLLENPDFEKAFINRMADQLNTTFHPESVRSHIEEYYYNLEPEIGRHHKRWRLRSEKWETHYRRMLTFASHRPEYVRKHFMQQFDTGPLKDLQLEASRGGKIVLNDNVDIRGKGFQGVYFENIPIQLKAVSDYGFRFSHWEGLAVEGPIRELSLSLLEETTYLKAVFEPFVHPLAGKLMINEISANNKKTKDWVELFNYTKEPINLENWVLTDTRNEFIFPDVVIAPNDYLVVCEDSAKFKKVFPLAYNVVYDMGFGLNKLRERMGLYSPLGAAVDSLAYDVFPTDSTYTLNLILPYLDNSNPENWEQNYGFGSPNAPNAYYVQSTIRRIQEQWMQVGVAGGVLLVCLVLLFFRWHGKL